MAYASRLYPRAKPRGFTLQWINDLICINQCSIQPSLCILQHINKLHSSSQNDSTDLL